MGAHARVSRTAAHRPGRRIGGRDRRETHQRPLQRRAGRRGPAARADERAAGDADGSRRRAAGLPADPGVPGRAVGRRRGHAPDGASDSGARDSGRRDLAPRHRRHRGLGDWPSVFGSAPPRGDPRDYRHRERTARVPERARAAPSRGDHGGRKPLQRRNRARPRGFGVDGRHQRIGRSGGDHAHAPDCDHRWLACSSDPSCSCRRRGRSCWP